MPFVDLRVFDFIDLQVFAFANLDVFDFVDFQVFDFVDLQVRVFAPEDLINQASYALGVAVKVLDYYNDFFGVPYPLPKQGIPWQYGCDMHVCVSVCVCVREGEGGDESVCM